MSSGGTDVLIQPNLTDPETQNEEPTETHIVGPLYTDDGKIPGRARILDAMVNGTPVEALCGFVWVPTKNPDNHPLCERCKAIVDRQGES
jgi:hypothetical protein